MTKEKYVRKAKLTDPAILAKKMRVADVKEIWASHRAKPLEALMYAFTVKKHKTFSIIGTKEEQVIGMFGVVPCPFHYGKGIAWLLSSDELLNHTKQFLKECPKWIDDMQQGYDTLYNYVHIDNKVSIRWLKYFGFVITKELPYGHAQEMFYHFERNTNEIKNTDK
jgi:RimJ/RimL family protein N-acetyltransferase